MSPLGRVGPLGREGALRQASAPTQAGGDRWDARAWWDALAVGIVLLAGERVLDLNASAAELLDVDRERARGATLIGVLRDHRLEAMWRGGVGSEVELRSRIVAVRVFEHGLVLDDVTELRSGQRDAAELIAVLSHELRTPVTAIRGALEALAPEGAGEGEADPHGRLLARALAEAERLSRLLDDLTVQARPPRERSVHLPTVVARAVSLLQPLAEASGATVATALDDVFVWVDEDKLLQVVLNLLENALLHGVQTLHGAQASHGAQDVHGAQAAHEAPAEHDQQRGGAGRGRRHGHVEVRAWRADDMARLEVRDGGAPLDPAVVPSLFEPHTQGGRRGKGAGLGLYIVRSIARSWGGVAWGGPYSPAPGEPAVGNAFGVSMPLSTRA